MDDLDRIQELIDELIATAEALWWFVAYVGVATYSFALIGAMMGCVLWWFVAFTGITTLIWFIVGYSNQ